MSATVDRPCVVLSVLEPDARRTAGRLAGLPAGCGMVEVRADHLNEEELTGLLRDRPFPVIVTARRPEEGGAFEGSERARRRLLVAALAAGARFVDVERGGPLVDLLDDPEIAPRVILSDHGAPCRLSTLRSLHSEMASTPASKLKIVPRAASADEILAVHQLLRAAPEEGRLACFALGRAGALSRLLAPSWGSWATYGSAEAGAETAAGQFPATDLIDLYDVIGIGRSTRRFALIGSSVFDSPSPAMHRAAYRAAALEARYLPVEIDLLTEFLPLVSGAGPVTGIEAFAVTMPFKEDAAKRSRACDAVAAASGAVNTVLDAGGTWQGFNTDGPAALSLIRSRIAPEGTRTAILGAGGTARAVAASLRSAGSRVVLFNRTASRAAEAARRLSVESAPMDELHGFDWEILVNATPLGSAGEMPIAPGLLRGRLVLDAVYAGRPTPLLDAARAAGLGTIGGFELLVAQAEEQFRRMTGSLPRPGVMAAAGMQWLRHRMG